ncbi:unnamed protein product, partial [Musa hybrid cultivar]
GKEKPYGSRAVMAAKGGGNIGSTSIDGVNLFSLSGQRFVSTWLPPKKLRALRKDKDYLQRVDLIQDLRFETATTKLKVTPDGDYVIASSIYSPQVKMFELRELSLKFVRHLVSEIINFQSQDTYHTAPAESQCTATVLYEKDECQAEAFLRSLSLAKEDALPLGERVAALEKN